MYKGSKSQESKLAETEAQWQQLDPIFILGRQRTGTSIMWRALRVAGFLGFPEGHLWYDLIKPLAWWRDPEYKAYLREDIFALGANRNLLLEKRLALLIDRFHRDLLPSDLVRWVSKSPGIDAIIVAPMLAEIFPRAQFVFMKRNPITTVNSAVEYLSKVHGNDTDLDSVFRSTCEHWVRVMKTWRQVRPILNRRYVEVAQEDIVIEPDQIASRVTDFLHASEWSQSVADVFKSKRENTAFPEKPVGEFFYPVNWTDEQQEALVNICGREMKTWGYPFDFQHPTGPDTTHIASREAGSPSMDEYYRWVQKQQKSSLQQELQMYKEQLTQIKQGRIMRLLNWLNKIKKQLSG